MLAVIGAASGSPTTASGEEIVSSCTVEIGISSFWPNQCTLVEEADKLILNWPGPVPRQYRVQLDGAATGTTAEASWNGASASTTDIKTLGLLTKSGDCWSGEGISVCFTRPAGTVGQADQTDVPLECQNLSGQQQAQCVLDMSEGFEESLGDQLQATSGSRSLTCISTAEDLYAPADRLANRVRAGMDAMGETKRWQFYRSSEATTVNGNTVTPVASNGDVVAIAVVDALTFVDDPRTQFLSPAEQEDWKKAQQFVRGLAQASGLRDRAFVVDFGEMSASLATTSGAQLLDVQPVTCF